MILKTAGVQLVPEFYNNVCALLPLLMLTKVVDRHRRHQADELGAPDAKPDSTWYRNSLRRHQAFLLLAALGEVLALMSAGWDHQSTSLDVVLIAVTAGCGLFFMWELLDGRLSG